jgi:cytoskeletal protein RodZ
LFIGLLVVLIYYVMVSLEQRLREARIQKKLTIEQAALATKIKPQFLEAIERGAYDKLPSPAYARGFVRNYAEFLGLPKAQIAALFKRDFDEKRTVKVLPEGMVKKSEFPINRLNIRRMILGVGALVLILAFLLFQARAMFFPPLITLSSPKEDSVVSQDVEVKGRTDANAIITINNEPVFVNSNGEFAKKISLFPGETKIIVKAKNRLGKESAVTRNVTVK